MINTREKRNPFAFPLTTAKRVQRNWELALAILIFIVAASYSVSLAIRSTDGCLIYSLDDAYIHMAMAKNLARHGVWGITRYGFSSSSSSPLWTLLIALAYALGGVNDRAPLALNILIGIFILVVAHHYLKRLGVSRPLRLLTLLLLVLDIPMVPLVLMGMEHLLHILLTLWFAGAAVLALAQPPPPREKNPARSLLLLGVLLAASRYEGLFLIGIVCLLLLVQRRLGLAIRLGAASLLPAIALGIISMSAGWYALPSSIIIKAGGKSASLLSAILKPTRIESWTNLIHRQEMAAVVLLGVSLLVLAAASIRRARSPALLLPLILIGMVVLHAHYVLSHTFWSYRYGSYLQAFAIFAAAVVLPTSLLRCRPRIVSILLPAFLLCAIGLYFLDYTDSLVPDYELDSARENYLEHVAVALFVRLHYPRDAIVINDIGAVSYYTDARILDLFGLGSLEPLKGRKKPGGFGRDDALAWADAKGAKVAILQVQWQEIAPSIPPQWEMAAQIIIPGGKRIGFFAIRRGEGAFLKKRVKAFFLPLAPKYGFRVLT